MCHVSPGAARERGWLTSMAVLFTQWFSAAPPADELWMGLDMNQTSGCYMTSTLHDFLHIFLLSDSEPES